MLAARQAMGLASALVLVVITALVQRIVGVAVAVHAGVLLALDPWLVAHSRMLHLDAPLTSLIAACLLACLWRWRARRDVRRRAGTRRPRGPTRGGRRGRAGGADRVGRAGAVAADARAERPRGRRGRPC